MPELDAKERKSLKVDAAAVCNACGKPIRGLVYVNPKGGYFPRKGEPLVVGIRAKETYDKECNDARLGKSPKPKPPEEKKKIEPVKPQATGKGQGVSFGTKFLEVAKKNKNIVTYDQAKQICPAYPGDPVAWARHLGATVRTEKKNKIYVVEKYN